MFRVGMRHHVCIKPLSTMVLQVAKYHNFVMADALAQIEKDCEKFCILPKFPSQKVCVCGAGSDVGRIACLFLKQQKVVKKLAMYDDVPGRYVLGVANDLAHIDTSTEVEAYQGRAFLKTALHNSSVVLICGGCNLSPQCCNLHDRDMFMNNVQFVRIIALSIAQFCPQAIVAVQTPPVDSNFTLVKHTLNLARVYDKRRLLGVNAINTMRANQLFCSITGSDPKASNIPVICGTGRCTRVPIFSAGKASNIPQTQVDCLTRLVREADDIICIVKSNKEQSHLSIGFSTARFVLNIMKGLFEVPTFIDSALVEQNEPDKCFGLEICSTPVTVGKGGIVEYAIPDINDFEMQLLEQARCDLLDSLNMGKCHALGDEYLLPESGKILESFEACKKCQERDEMKK